MLKLISSISKFLEDYNNVFYLNAVQSFSRFEVDGTKQGLDLVLAQNQDFQSRQVSEHSCRLEQVLTQIQFRQFAKVLLIKHILEITQLAI